MKPFFRVLLAMLLAAALACPAGLAQDCQMETPPPDEQPYAFFDGALFIGDSITRQLHNYTAEQRREDPRFLGNARFFTAQSYALYTASRKLLQSGAVNLTFRGREMALFDIVQEIQPRRVFILLGVNDYAGEKPEKAVGWAERIIDLTAQASPDTQVIFQSLTPVTAAFCRRKDYRALWDQYNEALKEMCLRKGAGYIDIASPLKDADGYLRTDFSSDGEYHLNPAGLRLWVDCLLDYARGQENKTAGTK